MITVLMFISLGCWMMYLSNKRKFNQEQNRVPEQLSSYKGNVLSSIFHHVLWWVGALLFFVGLLILLMWSLVYVNFYVMGIAVLCLVFLYRKMAKRLL